MRPADVQETGIRTSRPTVVDQGVSRG